MDDLDDVGVDVSGFEKLRPLGLLEVYSSVRHHLGFYHSVGVTASYKYPDQTYTYQELQSNIFSAVAFVIKKHPILSAIVVNEDTNTPYFARLPSVNLSEVVTILTRDTPKPQSGTDIDLDCTLQRQFNNPFKRRYGELPHWRLIITKTAGVENEFEASYIYHHAIGDGTSGMVFHKDFLLGLQNSTGLASNTIIVPAADALLPTLEEIQPAALPENPPPAPQNLWAGDKIGTPRATHFRSLVLPATTSEKLIQASRAESTTLTATLQVLVGAAIVKALPASTAFDELECTIPISLRNSLSSTAIKNGMGTWLDYLSVYFKRKDVQEFSWDEARRARAEIVNVLKSGRTSMILSGLATVSDMEQFFIKKVGKERTSSFNISNIGMIKKPAGEGRQGWEMGRMVFGRTAHVIGSAIDIAVVTGPDGCIVLGFSWQEDVVSMELVEAVKKGTEEGIKSLLEIV